ncbi:sugar ABC transporter permease [Dictyobacter sp. S3.2.2.5]|uniref:Sugar ABC transporter permease n=1 Tax=Dictyobacter halimunensis TaxID=3026934 RepID=A0ABQ6FNE6_9CHLR|nr:sugar ABC transporter permease [Dictyobacter sp. S3.2.2.5]
MAALPDLIGTPGRRRGGSPGRTRESQVRTLISPIEMRNPKVRIVYYILFAFMLCVLLSTAFPLYWLFTGSLKQPLEMAQIPPTFWPLHPTWQGIQDALTQIDWPRAFFNTVFLSVGSWVLGTLVSTTAAYSFSRLRPRFGNLLLFLFMCTLMVPSIALFITQYATILDVPIFHWNLIGTPFALWFPGAFNAMSIFIYKLFMDTIPTDLVEAARLDGARHWTIFWRICLPLIKPALVVGLIFSFIADWNGFLWPLLTLSRSGWEPIGLALYQYQLSDTTLVDQIAAASLASLVPFILVAIFQNQIIKSNAAFAGMKG